VTHAFTDQRTPTRVFLVQPEGKGLRGTEPRTALPNSRCTTQRREYAEMPRNAAQSSPVEYTGNRPRSPPTPPACFNDWH
jgi:hypothetical protein